jgi:Ser/Thr protein kinase RdoA (MazF antagonist)
MGRRGTNGHCNFTAITLQTRLQLAEASASRYPRGVTSASSAAAYNSFTVERAQEVLSKALARSGNHAVDDLRPLGAPADNAIIHVPELNVVARIAVDQTHRARLAREIDTATWLCDRGIPTVIPARKAPTPQLEVLDGRVISWWDYLPSTDRGSLAQLGDLLRRVHAEPNPPLDNRLDPWARIDHQIQSAAQALPAEDIDILIREQDRLRSRWHASDWANAATSAIHGDAYTGNTLVVDGQAHLLDFEDSAIGPPAWDVASVLGAFQLGWLDVADYDDFCRGYGSDLSDLPGVDVLVDIILFRRCAWFASRASREPSVIEAVRHRVHTLSLPHHLKYWRAGGA